MTSGSAPYVAWFEEDADTGRRVRAAWIVRDISAGTATHDRADRQEALAYLGSRAAVTRVLREEVAALYPDIAFDWEAIAQSLQTAPGMTNVHSLTDDELALRLRELVAERNISLLDLALHLGYRQRQVIPEVTSLLEDTGAVARFERTSGSVFDYLLQHHLEYAFLVYKARLFLEGSQQTLDAVIRAEPDGFSDGAWSARRAFWRSQLDAYRSRAAPGS